MSAVEPQAVGLPEVAEHDEDHRHVGFSLKDRMRQRQEELSERETEIFPVPRWADVLAVELKAVPWEKTEEIIQSNLRSPKLQTIRSSADEIISATVGFYEIKDDGEGEAVEDGPTWLRIAQGVIDLSADMPPKLANRTALLELCSSQGVMALSASYRAWLQGANTGIGDQLRRDFRRTP